MLHMFFDHIRPEYTSDRNKNECLNILNESNTFSFLSVPQKQILSDFVSTVFSEKKWKTPNQLMCFLIFHFVNKRKIPVVSYDDLIITADEFDIFLQTKSKIYPEFLSQAVLHRELNEICDEVAMATVLGTEIENYFDKIYP